MRACMSLAAAMTTSMALLAGPTPAAAADHPPQAPPFGGGALNGTQLHTPIQAPITATGNALGVLGYRPGR